MGNYRFRLSSMISTSWFLKLKHLVLRAKKTETSHHRHHHHSVKKKKPLHASSSSSSSSSSQSTAAAAAAAGLPPLMQPNRSSYYIPSHHRNPPTTARSRAAPAPAPAVSPAAKPAKPRTRRRADSALCTTALSSAVSSAYKKAGEDLEVASQLKLPPILTRPAPREEECSTTPTGRRIRVRRMSSPRCGRRRQRQRAVAESLVVMKASANPRRDFAESMAEMIVANGIRGGRELEELLACYLSLNAKEYHEVIVKVFERVWFLLTSDVGV